MPDDNPCILWVDFFKASIAEVNWLHLVGKYEACNLGS